MQKYIHLVQIVETEKVAANQLRTQLEDQDTEIERLKSEVQQFSYGLWPIGFWRAGSSDVIKRVSSELMATKFMPILFCCCFD